MINETTNMHKAINDHTDGTPMPIRTDKLTATTNRNVELQTETLPKQRDLS